MEPSSSAYGSISDWDWDVRLDRDNVVCPFDRCDSTYCAHRLHR